MNFHRLSLAAIFAAALLTGCGSGSNSGPQTTGTPNANPGDNSSTTDQNKLKAIKGVAAFGVPLRGAAVTIIGRNSKGQIDTSITGTATGEDGSFSFNVPASWKAPILLQATANIGDRVVVLHSILYNDFDTTATQAQRINITPFTEALFASVVGQQPTVFYKDMQTAESTTETADDASTLAALTPAVVSAKHSEIIRAIAPLLMAQDANGKPVLEDRPDAINLVSTEFSANHTGMDKALDMTSMYYASDRSKLLLANKADPSGGVTIDIATKTVSGALPAAVADTIETINKLPNDLTTLYKNAVPGSSVLNTYIASSYLNDSTNADSLRSVLLGSDYAKADFSLNDIKAIYKDGNNNYRYDVVFRIRKANQTTEYQSTTIAQINGQWQFVGNGRAMHSSILSFYARNYDLSGVPVGSEPTTAGLVVRLEQPSPANWFDKATIAGPGLNGNVTLVRSNLTTNVNGVTSGCSVMSIAANNCETRIKFHNQAELTRDFGYDYNVALYRKATDTTPHQQYTVRLPVKPYLSTDNLPALASLSPTRITDKNTNATETSPTLGKLRDFTGGDLQVYWQKGLVNDVGYTYFIGLDIDVCLQGQLSTKQGVTAGDYLDSANNRLVTFSTDITAERPEYPYLRVFPSLSGLEPNIKRRDLRVFAQDENDRVYYASYSNALSATCQ